MEKLTNVVKGLGESFEIWDGFSSFQENVQQKRWL